MTLLVVSMTGPVLERTASFNVVVKTTPVALRGLLPVPARAFLLVSRLITTLSVSPTVPFGVACMHCTLLSWHAATHVLKVCIDQGVDLPERPSHYCEEVLLQRIIVDTSVILVNVTFFLGEFMEFTHAPHFFEPEPEATKVLTSVWFHAEELLSPGKEGRLNS